MSEHPQHGAHGLRSSDEPVDVETTQVRPRRGQDELWPGSVAPQGQQQGQVTQPMPGPAPQQQFPQQGALQQPRGPKQIETLPPLDELLPGIPVSEATGQPRRAPMMLVAIGFLYASALVSAVALVKVWWDMIHLHSFPTSIRMIEWAKPESWSLTAVLLAVAAAAAGATMVAAPAIAAFNAWNGYRWSRIAAIVAVVLSCLAILLNDWAYAAIPLAAFGAGWLWLPAVTRYFDLWGAFRGKDETYPRDLGSVHYGPEPRYL